MRFIFLFILLLSPHAESQTWVHKYDQKGCSLEAVAKLQEDVQKWGKYLIDICAKKDLKARPSKDHLWAVRLQDGTRTCNHVCPFQENEDYSEEKEFHSTHITIPVHRQPFRHKLDFKDCPPKIQDKFLEDMKLVMAYDDRCSSLRKLKRPSEDHIPIFDIMYGNRICHLVCPTD